MLTDSEEVERIQSLQSLQPKGVGFRQLSIAVKGSKESCCMLNFDCRSTACGVSRAVRSADRKYIQAGTKPNLDTTPDPRAGTAVKSKQADGGLKNACETSCATPNHDSRFPHVSPGSDSRSGPRWESLSCFLVHGCAPSEIWEGR